MARPDPLAARDPRRETLRGGRSARARRVAPPTSLLRCRVGSTRLVIDLRDLHSVEPAAPRPGLPQVDLRRLLGGDPGAPGVALACQGPGGATLQVLVDPGVELVQVAIELLGPLPPLLGRVPALRCLRGVVDLGGSLAFLLDPQRLAPEAEG